MLIDGTESEPHTVQQVVDRHRADTLPVAALYWSPGMDGWTPIARLVQPPPPPGTSVTSASSSPLSAPPAVLPLGYDVGTYEFTGALPELIRIGVRAVQSRGWTAAEADDSVGLLTFETKMSWGSWSGITATLSFTETTPYRWRVSGTGKQNVRGHQLGALDLGEPDQTVRQAIETMAELASQAR